MKLNNKNLDTFGKYFIMVLVALIIYRMATPVVEGWKLKHKDYDCRVVKAKDHKQLAKILGNNAKKVKVCHSGNYAIVNKLKLPGDPYGAMPASNGPGECRKPCRKEEDCVGFVYDGENCYFHNNSMFKKNRTSFKKKSLPTYQENTFSFIKMK